MNESIKEALECYLDCRKKDGDTIMRKLISDNMGFNKLALVLKTPSTNVHRMLSDRGNPTAKNLFKIIYTLNKELQK